MPLLGNPSYFLNSMILARDPLNNVIINPNILLPGLNNFITVDNAGYLNQKTFGDFDDWKNFKNLYDTWRLSVDLKNGIQDTEITTINTKDLYQDTRLTTVETKLNAYKRVINVVYNILSGYMYVYYDDGTMDTILLKDVEQH